MDTSPPLSSQQADTEVADRSWWATLTGDQTAFGWLLAALLGIASISLAPRGDSLRLFFPVVIMLVYVWISYPRGGRGLAGVRHVRIAQLADSAYFLGFLWTLWALIDAFVLRGEAPASDSAFQVFGYALVTTAFGMGTRLFLLQFKYAASDQLAEAEFSVEQQLQRYSAAMQDSVLSIQTFFAGVNTLTRNVDNLALRIEHADEHFASMHEETMTAVADNIASVVQEIRDALKAPVQEYGRAVRGFTGNVDVHSQQLTETIGKMTAALAEGVVTATESSRNVLRVEAERLTEEHTLAAQYIRNASTRMAGELQLLSDRVAAVRLPTEPLQDLTASFTELNRGIRGLGADLEPGAQVRSGLASLANELPQRTEVVAGALDDVAVRLRSIRIPEETTLDVSALTASVDSLNKALAQLYERAADKRWETHTQSASDAILKLAAAATKFRQSIDIAAPSPTRPQSPQRKSWWRRG